MLNNSQANNISFMADLEEARFLWAQLYKAYLELGNPIEMVGPVKNKYYEIENLIKQAEEIVPNLFNLENKVDFSALPESVITALKSIVSNQLLNSTSNKSFAVLANYIEICRQAPEIFTQAPEILKQDCDNAITFASIIIEMFRSMDENCIPDEVKILVEQKISPLFCQTRSNPGVEVIYANSFLFKNLTAKEDKMNMLENAYVQVKHVLECYNNKAQVIQATLTNLTFLSAKWPLVCASYSTIQDIIIKNKYSKIHEFICINQLGINLITEKGGVKAKLRGLEFKDFVKFTYKIKILCSGITCNDLLTALNEDQIELNINEISELAKLEAKMNLAMPMQLQLQDDLHLQVTLWKQIKVLRLKYAELNSLYEAVIIKSDNLQNRFHLLTNLITNDSGGANGIGQNLLLVTEDYIKSIDRQSLELDTLSEELTIILQEATSLCEQCCDDENSRDYILTNLHADARAELNTQIWTSSYCPYSEEFIYSLTDQQAILLDEQLLKEERNKLAEEAKQAVEIERLAEIARLAEEAAAREQAAREQAVAVPAIANPYVFDASKFSSVAEGVAAATQIMNNAPKDVVGKILSPRSPEAERRLMISAGGL